MKFAQAMGLTAPTGLAQPDTTNADGNPAYSEILKHAVARIALTGVLQEGAHVSEATQTGEFVPLCTQAAKECPAYLLKAARVSRKANFKLFPKLAIAALVALVDSESWAAQQYERQAVDILKGYNAGQLLELALVCKGKLFGKGLGRRAQRLLGRALAAMPADRFEAMTLADREDLRRLLRLLHPKALPSVSASLLAYVVGEDRKPVSQLQGALERLKDPSVTDAVAVELIGLGLPFNATKGIVGNRGPAVWTAILGQMSPLQVLLNLRSLDEKGVITPAALDKFLAAQNVDTLRLVPHDVLRPMAHAPGEYREPLVRFLGRLAARPLPGLEGKRVGVLLDYSGSMSQGEQPAWNLAVTLATPILASCPDRHLVFFGAEPWPEGDTSAVPSYGKERLPYLKGCPKEAILHNLIGLHPRSSTETGRAVDYFTERAIPLDVLFVFTDEQQNGARQAIDAWRKYLRAVNPQARLVVVNVSTTPWHMVADGKDRATVIQTITPLVYEQLARFDESPTALIERLG